MSLSDLSSSHLFLPLQVVASFEKRFIHRPVYLIRAPGRVNLIGEHTDYNDGFVLPMAIDKNVWLAVSPRRDSKISVYSLDISSSCEIDVSNITTPIKGWGRYVQAVAWVLAQEGYELSGWDGVVGSDVPIGSGLSSSAALELAVARCFSEINDITWDPVNMAKLCQFAENNWVGMNCGIMDQLIVATGQRDHALLIDCRSLDLRPIAMPDEVSIIIMDTATRRGLVDSAYNERRAQCEAAASFFKVPFLRDVSIALFEERAGLLEEKMRKRCRHVIYENERTTAAFKAMAANDIEALGGLMNQSHDSLRDDYEVTNAELDIIVELAREHPAALGARMTGAGFGGCAIALVKKQAVALFTAHIYERYKQKTGLVPALYVCKAEQGVSLEVLPQS